MSIERQERPLADVRVLALEQYGAGPFATAQLVELGADVIKVEDPNSGGDVGRLVPPYASEDSSLFFEAFNRGKRSLLLDLETIAGRKLFEGLVAISDVVFANVRGDVPAKLRLRYEDLRHLNKRIVCCFLTSYGIASSEQKAPGYDYVMQGRAGWMSLTGEPDGPPAKSGLSMVDYSSGLAAATAIIAAVLAARRSGVGTDCDLALFDTAIGMLTYVGAWHLSAGYKPSRTRNSAHPSLIPFQNFKTLDGWIVVACAKEKFWKRFVAAIGRQELVDDPRYESYTARKKNARALIPELEFTLSQQPTETWLKVLSDAGVPCAPVNDVAGALIDPLVAERQMIVETEHPSLGTVRQLAGVVRVGEFNPVKRRGPLLGEHTAEVLYELLGIDREQIRKFRIDGAFGRIRASSDDGREGPPS